MSEHTAQLNMLWGSLIIEELYRLGVRDICIAPGSRSTPLTLNAAEHDGLIKHIHFDERGLGFFALGLAKATQRPVAVICSSGTAGANLLPAVVEANMDHVPLVILTADRPDELHHVGANQSVDQNHLFGSHVVAYRTMQCPAADQPAEAVLTLVDACVSQTTAGPVHINCMFREPFVPEERLNMASVPGLRAWAEQAEPFSRVDHAASVMMADSTLKPIKAATRGILIVGRLNSDEEARAAEALADRLKWPVLADLGSGIRLGTDKPWLISHYDMLLETCELPPPDFVLQVGGRFTSKYLASYLKEHSDIPMLQIQNANAITHNPLHRPLTRVSADIVQTVSAIESTPPVDTTFFDAWFDHNHQCGLVIKTDTVKILTGASVARVVTSQVGEGEALFVGNSLAVRDVERYAPADAARPHICTNRGASGIDGNIATALGFAKGKNVPLTILIGDLTALHDLNSLSLLKDMDQNVILVIENNDGGGIFRKLPIASQTEHVNEYFVMPHGYKFSSSAEMFGLTYHAPDSLNGFETVFATAKTGGKHLIEITLGS